MPYCIFFDTTETTGPAYEALGAPARTFLKRDNQVYIPQSELSFVEIVRLVNTLNKIEQTEIEPEDGPTITTTRYHYNNCDTCPVVCPARSAASPYPF